MSTDEATKRVENMRDTGAISHAAARSALSHPVETEKLALLDRIESAIYGDEHLDPPGNTAGILKDVREMKITIFSARQSILTTIWLFGAIGTIIGLVLLYIEATKH